MSDEPRRQVGSKDCLTNPGTDPLLGLVSHVNRSPKSQMSKLQLTIPIVLRARLARASRDHSIPQLALIRTAIAAYLTSLESRYPSEELGSVPDLPDRQEGGHVASFGAPSPVSGGEPPEPDRPAVAEPEPELEPMVLPEPEPMVSHKSPESTVPAQAPRKRSKSKS